MRIALLALLGLLQASCSETEPEDWIEVPLAEGVFFDSGSTMRQEIYEILVLSNSALEFKLGLGAGDSLSYQWDVDMTEPELLTAEFHGHTHRVNEEPGTVMFYKIHTDGQEQGTLVAPFEGIHGWYLDNRSAEDITVNLTVAGFFTDVE